MPLLPLDPPNADHVARITKCIEIGGQVEGTKNSAYDSLPSTVTVGKGKVRDAFSSPACVDSLVLVTTDRQSAFDRHLCSVPYKGAVLNLISAFYFEQTKDILPNHIRSVPHGNVTVAKKADPFPVEFVVRAYMTGSTDTSIWKNYSVHNCRNYCGHSLREGYKKNEILDSGPIMTPTTKGEHDRPISVPEIISEGLMNKEDVEKCEAAALAIFKRGQSIAAERGFILVDTKFEMGRDPTTGEIIVIDEMMTPDSSRYWIADSYAAKIAEGKEPQNIDKEFIRLWFKENCDPYKDEVLPEAPKDLVAELSRRYIYLYEAITGKKFDFPESEGDVSIVETIKKELS